MSAGQKLRAYPEGIVLRPTATRAAALEAAVSYLLERGEPGAMTLTLSANRQEFELRGTGEAYVVCTLPSAKPAAPSAKTAKKNTEPAAPAAALIKGRPPASGWSKVKAQLQFPAPDFRGTRKLGGKEVPGRLAPDARNYCFVHALGDDQVIATEIVSGVAAEMREQGAAGYVHDFLFKRYALLRPQEGADRLYLCVAIGSEPLRAIFRRYI